MNNAVVYDLYKTFRSIMHRNGREVALPENTDYRKTYSWRYMCNFCEKMDHFGIPNDEIPNVMEMLIKYAKTHNLLNRGFAVLAKASILDLVIEDLNRQIKDADTTMTIIKRSHEFLLNQKQSLLDKSNSLCNITKWYTQGYLNIEYISISKTCLSALRHIDKNERELFPKQTEMLKIQLRMLSNKTINSELHSLLENDFVDA